jgi:hypothetical protein
MLAWGTSSEAGSITFNFDCTIIDVAAPNACSGPAGSFGTLKLSDSSVNQNRVDVDITIIPAGLIATDIDTFFLNYTNAIPVEGPGVNREFRLVDPALANSIVNVASINYNSNGLGPFNTAFDVKIDPNSGTRLHVPRLDPHHQLDRGSHRVGPRLQHVRPEGRQQSLRRLQHAAIQFRQRGTARRLDDSPGQRRRRRHRAGAGDADPRRDEPARPRRPRASRQERKK